MEWDGRPVDEVNPSPYTALNPDARPIGTYETKTAVRTGKRSILAILRNKKGGCEQSRLLQTAIYPYAAAKIKIKFLPIDRVQLYG